MKSILLLSVLLGQAAFAGVVQESALVVKTSIPYVLIEAEAKCTRPKFEDDSYKPFFAPADFPLIKSYQDKGYRARLVGKTCGQFSADELSADKFEKVRVILVEVETARGDLDAAIRAVFEKFD